MIRKVIDLLQSEDWINAGENVEIAKGKYELPLKIKDIKSKIKREWQSRKL